jgi:magnesium chelatase subunit D
MSLYDAVYPFAAIVGQEQLKLALILNAVNPRIGGLLVRGEKGTAKSTTVRALAALLPEIEVFRGCPYGYGPGLEKTGCNVCGLCLPPRTGVRRRVRVVTLPLNATEDRVVGGIEFDLAVRTGRRAMQPGLLARAHRGILYVDEVNLLDDHIVDVILDAAASGENRIEREGISFAHASEFVLVGTMNPEEGELRPQLLDRFGLCVEVAAVADRDQRITTMERREAYDADPRVFIKAYEEENRTTACRVLKARQRLDQVAMPEHLRPVVAELCTENHVAGHRADLVIEQAAKALAAFRERSEVTLEDIREIARLALTHRRRDAAPPPPPPPPEHDHDHQHDEPPQDDPEQNQENPEQPREPQEGPQAQPEEMNASENEDQGEADPQERQENRGSDAFEQVFDVGETFKVKNFTSPKDRTFRRGSGRRSRTRISQKQGRYVKSVMGRDTGDVALDATLRAAAPYQRHRRNGNGLAVVLRSEDIREKIREKRIGNFLLFIVDASGSMGARGRMTASKGAVMSLLLDAYQKRDRIAMVTFRKEEAVVNLPPTASIELAATLLAEMPVGGRTPLSAGLAKSYEVLRNYLLREPTGRPIAIIITDGRSNVAMGDGRPLDEVLALADRLALDARIRFVVVDTESKGMVTFGMAHQLAAAMNAKYFKIEDLKADSLLNIVKGEA